MKTIRELQEQREPNVKSITSIEREKSQSFYHSSKWRKCRTNYMQMKRNKHEKIALEVYEKNIDINSPAKIMEFMQSDLPLSEMSLKKGVIQVGNTVDHIKPISDGGKKLCFDNLRVLTHREHSKVTWEQNNKNYGKL